MSAEIPVRGMFPSGMGRTKLVVAKSAWEEPQMDVDLCVGTVGMSVWFSKDLGENWKRASSSAGLNAECRVWTLASSPATPQRLYAGGDEGVHRWDESEQRWTHLRSPMDGRPVWAIAQSPRDPRVVLAGCRPTALYRSDDAGTTWQQIVIPFAQSCAQVISPRPTQILFDPYDKDTIWVGVEVDASTAASTAATPGRGTTRAWDQSTSMVSP